MGRGLLQGATMSLNVLCQALKQLVHASPPCGTQADATFAKSHEYEDMGLKGASGVGASGAQRLQAEHYNPFSKTY